MVRRDMPQHRDDYSAEHIVMTMEKIEALERENASLKRNNCNLQKRNWSLFAASINRSPLHPNQKDPSSTSWLATLLKEPLNNNAQEYIWPVWTSEIATSNSKKVLV